ncbi:hypothetical protein ABW19_dt0207354 [Dactylella cylindrospora]|nr:hypothetical protein ABW19_dt0207354 [Dactylella cylindrospora]
MPRRRTDHPTSPPHHMHTRNPSGHHGHRRQQSQSNPGPPSLPVPIQQPTIVQDDPLLLQQVNALNFSVIHRLIPSLQRIIHTTSICTAYKIINENWDRLDIEGPLFFLDLNIYHPQFYLPGMSPTIQASMSRYAAFVLNRKGLNNLLIPLPKKSENVDTTNSVLISMLMDWGDCYGLSVFDQEGTSTASDSDTVGKLVLDLVNDLENEEERIKQMANNPQFTGYPLQPVGFPPPQPYFSPSVERPQIDLMAALGPKIGAGSTSGYATGGQGSGYASGYASGDGGYASGGSALPEKGRKIDINAFFGGSVHK